MCLDLDLFGDVIVTINDVNLWLDIVAKMPNHSNSRRDYYAENSDVASKIKLSKLNGSFEKLINQHLIDKENSKSPLTLYSTKYVEAPAIAVCPPYYHKCNNPHCPVLKKVLAHEKAALRYAKQKKSAKRQLN